jgi:phenylacetate-CoA ligase
MDLYGPLLEKALFPAFEAVRGRPTVALLEMLREAERWPRTALVDLQLGLLRRLLRHAYAHTTYYRELFDRARVHPDDVTSLSVLHELPLLDRDRVRLTFEARTADAPPRWVIKKSTSGTTGQPVVVRYNAESRHWRDATRWRAYGWAGYRVGMRALHYWGAGPAPASWIKRKKIALDRVLKRDYYVDCTPRGPNALSAAVAQVRALRPHVIVAYASGAAALARFIVERGLRDWDRIPVLVGAERLWAHDRAAIERAFGPAFETYGSREVMLMGSECEVHDGLHTSMETMITELVVRDGDRVRPARPGELGEVVVTDLHNLACPMIRYVTGDLAIARAPGPCACGRHLDRIGPVEGRVTETLRDGHGNPVGGLVFNILFGVMDHVARKFQVIQRRDGSVLMKVVPNRGDRLPEPEYQQVQAFARKYLPATPFAVEYVDDIPLTEAGKRKVVVVER